VTIELRGDVVTLRAFRPEEYELMMTRLPGSADANQERIRRSRVERSGTRTSVELLFAVEADGRLVGDVQGRNVEMAMPPGVWEVGIELWDAADRGRGRGREAITLLTSHLFEYEGAHRVQGSTDVGNVAMRRVFEALGFTDEGTMRGFMPTGNGSRRDFELYAVTLEEWERTRDG
jgi:RimJ/RimL family protein N-acetyltransferase